MKQDNNYNLLINKLVRFIRKFYLNKMIHEFFLSIGLKSPYFIVIALLENYFYWNDRS